MPPSVVRATPPSSSIPRTGVCSKNSTPSVGGDAGEFGRELAGVHEGGASPCPSARRGTSASDLGAHGGGVEMHVVAVLGPSSHSTWCGSIATLRVPVRSKSAVILYSCHGVPIASRLAAPSRSSCVQLLGPAALAVHLTVREARFDEPAVATRRGPADRLRLEHRRPGGRGHAPSRGSPSRARVAATDDREVGVVGRGEFGCRVPGASSSQNTPCRASRRAASTTAAGASRSKTVVFFICSDRRW